MAARPLDPISATLRSMFGTDDLPGLTRGLLVHDPAGWMPATVAGRRHPPARPARRGRPPLARHPARRRRAGLEVLQLLAGPAGRAGLGLRAAGAAAARRPTCWSTSRTTGRCSRWATAARSTSRCCRPTRWPSPACRRSWWSPTRRRCSPRCAPRCSTRTSPRCWTRSTREVRVGARTLLGSVASGIAYGMLRAADSLPGSTADNIDTAARRARRRRPGRAGRRARPASSTCSARPAASPSRCPSPSSARAAASSPA